MADSSTRGRSKAKTGSRQPARAAAATTYPETFDAAPFLFAERPLEYEPGTGIEDAWKLVETFDARLTEAENRIDRVLARLD